jgi:hypothetical protein
LETLALQHELLPELEVNIRKGQTGDTEKNERQSSRPHSLISFAKSTSLRQSQVQRNSAIMSRETVRSDADQEARNCLLVMCLFTPVLNFSGDHVAVYGVISQTTPSLSAPMTV